MNKEFSFAEELSSFPVKMIAPLLIFFYVCGAMAIAIAIDALTGRSVPIIYLVVLTSMISLPAAPVVSYAFFRHRIPVSVEISGQMLYVKNTVGRHLKEF